MKNRTVAPFWVLLILAILFPMSGSAETVDKVVAVVNEEPITLYDLDKAMAKGAERLKRIQETQGVKTKEKDFKEFRTMALKALIDDKLLEQEMKKKNIVITPEDQQKALNNILERNKMDLAQLKSELSAKGRSWESYQVDMNEQLKRIKFMGQVIAPRVKVTDADLDEFFAKNPDKFAQFQSVEMAQIIIPLDPTANDEAIASAKLKALEAQSKAEKGEDFAELGKKYSDNPQTAVKETYAVAQLAPPIQIVLADMKEGQVSEPIRSSLGLHIIKLYSRKTMAGEEFKAIREQIREKVFEYKVEEELQKYLDGVKENSFIEIKA